MSLELAKKHLRLDISRRSVINQQLLASNSTTDNKKQKLGSEKRTASAQQNHILSTNTPSLSKKRKASSIYDNSYIETVEKRHGSLKEIKRQAKRARSVLNLDTEEEEKHKKNMRKANLAILTRQKKRVVSRLSKRVANKTQRVSTSKSKRK